MLANIAFSLLLSIFFTHPQFKIYCQGRTSLFLFSIIYKRIANRSYLNVFCPLSELIALFWHSWLSRLSKLPGTGLKSELSFFRVAVLGTSGCNASKMTLPTTCCCGTNPYAALHHCYMPEKIHSGTIQVAACFGRWPFTNTPWELETLQFLTPCHCSI